MVHDHLDELITRAVDQNELKLENSLNHSCKYYTTEEFLQLVNNNTENFSVFNLNIRSISNKIDDLEEFLGETKTNKFSFSILTIQELWRIKNDSNLILEGYHPIITNRRNNIQGGGVGIYLHDKYRYDIIDEFSIINNDFESLIIKVFVNDKKFKIILNLYRIPTGSINVFTTWVNNTLNSLKMLNPDEIIFCSDLNLNLIRFNEHAQTNEFLNTMISQSFLPLITLPTRLTETCANLLDNIFTNKQQDMYVGGLLYCSLSDHLPVFYLNINKKNTQKEIPVKKRNMSAKKVEVFKQELSNTDWSLILNDSNPKSAFQTFSDLINSKFEKYFPLEIVKQNKRNTPIKPWMNRDILKLRKTKDRLFKYKTDKRTEYARNRFEEASRVFKRSVRKAKNDYYEQKFKEYSQDMKKTWETINTLVKKKKKSNSVPSLFTDEFRNYTTFTEIAEGFNSFFVDVGPRLANEIPHCDTNFQEFLGAPIQQNFIFQNINEDIIYATLSKLKPKNSSSHDNISTNLLKQIMPCIISPVIHLFNLSFKTGFIPNDYKIAKVIPIFKAGEMDKFDNYRPISILNAFSKLMEKVVVCQMIKYLNKYKILYDHQYGFRPGRNTSQPLIQLINKIYEGLNSHNSEYTLGIFIDLKKAFDTCNITVLIKKLEHYGFHGVSKKWFTSYLSNRTQYVEINGVKSSLKEITHGVPQGSVLGPILFLLYINDLPNSIDIFSSLFADDTIFINSNENLKVLEINANLQLEKAKVWFQANKLSLNVSKTKYIVFRTNRMAKIPDTFKLSIGGRDVERIGNNCNTKSFKFVGIHLDEFLTWEHHINHVINKISSSNFALNQIKKIIPMNIRKTVYNSLVKPHLEYSIIAWGNSNYDGINRLKTKHKQAIRNVANASYNAHVDPLLGKLGLLNFEDTLTYYIANFVKTIFMNKAPSSFEQIFEPMSSQRVVKLKNERPKLKALESFPNVMFPKIWNDLDNSIRLSNTCKTLKLAIKEKSIQKYKNFQCMKNKCYVCKKL
jgi:hypothetical protein